MDTNKKILDLSESFYSIQGEGATTGVPAYFIRLKGCNLSCGFSTKALRELGKEVRKQSEYRAGGNDHEFADLYKEGKATWCCDSASVWLKGNKISAQDMWKKWKDDNVFDWILDGRVHLVWTGGEPTMPNHQKGIYEFIELTKSTYQDVDLYNEIETNGSIIIDDPLYDELDQINCSAKLANSGMDAKKRIVPDAIDVITTHRNYWFKFVVSSEDDFNEIESDYLKPFDIDPKRVIVMPGLDKQDNYFERTKFIMETAKERGFVGLSRMHIAAWDQATGV